MSDCAHDVSLMTLIVDGVAHGFSVNGQRFVLLTVSLVPALERTIKTDGINAHQYIPDDGHTRYTVASVLVSAAKTFAGILSEAFGPIRDSQVTAHTAQGCAGGNG